VTQDSQPTVAVSVDSTPRPDMAEVVVPPCERCGQHQPVASIAIERGSMISAPSFICFCGHRNGAGGTFQAEQADGELRAVFYDADIKTLGRLRDALRRLQVHEGELDDEEIVSSVGAVSPEAARWLSNRENRRDLMAAMTVLITALSVLIAWMAYNKAPEPAAPQIENLIVQIERGEISDPGLPRKAPCWCGSGKKYKNCHAPAEDAPPPEPGPPAP